MSERSYVPMGQHLCVVCAQPYDSGAILLDRRLRASMERNTITGWGMCPKHEALRAEDMVALVACDGSKSTKNSSGNIQPDDAYRTGAVAHIKKYLWEHIMDVPTPEGMVGFCDDEVINLLQVMQQVGEEGKANGEVKK